ncbi:MAG TPA: hypothetical protein DIW30_06410 [Bacteroidales bacterium]|nr:hypothetical protein [Bacteroidales bacterium]
MQKRGPVILLCLLLCGSIAAGGHRYVRTSVLNTGKFVKIQVRESGIYRITYEALRDMGINPQQVRILGYGGAMLNQDFSKSKIDDLPSVPFYMEKGSDGVFGAGDYIVFYGQGVTSWTYTGGRFSHTINPYSEYGYYFVSDNAGEQRLLERRESVLQIDEDAQEIRTFTDRYVHEEELVNLLDKTGRSGGGREFYGETLSQNSPSVRWTWNIPDITEGTSLRAYLNMAANSQQKVRIQVGIGESTDNMTISSMENQGVTVYAMSQTKDSYFDPSEGEEQQVMLTYSNPTAAGMAYLNYMELTVERDLVMRDHYLSVRNANYTESGKQGLYKVKGCTKETQVWNISKLDSIYSVPCQTVGDELWFITDCADIEEFVLVEPRQCAYMTPSVTGKAGNQDLHRLRDVDMVIIYPTGFHSAANRLAQAHECLDGLSVACVQAEQIYNEFSSGTPDATAYRWLMKMLYDRAQEEGGNMPKYLLLMGDGSFDNRKLLQTSPQNTLLTYQARNSISEPDAYATDDYFCWLDDHEGSVDTDTRTTMDISVGRLPVNSAEEAEQTVGKLIGYMESNSVGNWKTQLCFLADDGDAGTHTLGADRAAEGVRQKTKDFVIHKIYTDAYQQITNATGESYPIAQSKMQNLLQEGVLMFNYSGHGGYNSITNEGLLDAKGIREMSNTNLGFWLFSTCSFSHFDSFLRSAGEEAILNTHGGAVGVFSACRTVYATQNSYLNQFVCEALFTKSEQYRYENTLGDAIRIAKNRARGFKPTQDKNILPYILLGDPAIRLPFPDDYKVVTTLKTDTLRALSTQRIEGYIADITGDTIRDFTGEVSLTMWDKQQRLLTNDNDQTDESKKVRTAYMDFPNILFKGNATVEDGVFEMSFMVPKDIQYNYGNGRMALYAYDRETLEEAIGSREDFAVGGSSSLTIEDTKGPELHLYLNNASFKNGGKTHEFPHFYAHIEDENGINTVGSGIGHDLMMVIDEDPQQTYTLNEYFTAETGSYQAGMVSYKLSEMAEGHHNIRFRAWDLLNNSSSATLQFEVVKGYAPQIFSVMTYPNPVSRHGTVHMAIEHDKPDMTLETEVNVYDFSGRRIWSHKQSGTQDVEWQAGDMNTECGVYFYNVIIRTTDGSYDRKTGKIIVIQ